MKNYELIAELTRLPAGYEVNFGKAVFKDEFENGENSIFVSGTVADIEVDENEGVIELLS